MKYSKKLFALLLSVIILASFVGCGLSLPEDDGSSQIDSSIIVVDTTSENAGVAYEQTAPSSTDVSFSDAERSTVSKKTGVKTTSPVGTGVATAVNPTSIPAFSGTYKSSL